MLRLPEIINHENALVVREEGLKALSLENNFQVDGSMLREFDSSVLAILMAWKRAYPDLIVCNVPQKLSVLAQVYGLTELMQFQKA